MPIYQYKAMTPDGKSKGGIIDADSPKEARAALRKDKLLVTDIKLSKGGKAGEPNWLKKVRELQGVSGPDKKRNEQVAAVTRQMASLLMSGIPLAEALRAVIEQAPDRRIESVFRDIREKVTTGLAFGDALALHPAYFTAALLRDGQGGRSLRRPGQGPAEARGVHAEAGPDAEQGRCRDDLPDHHDAVVGMHRRHRAR